MSNLFSCVHNPYISHNQQHDITTYINSPHPKPSQTPTSPIMPEQWQSSLCSNICGGDCSTCVRVSKSISTPHVPQSNTLLAGLMVLLTLSLRPCRPTCPQLPIRRHLPNLHLRRELRPLLDLQIRAHVLASHGVQARGAARTLRHRRPPLSRHVGEFYRQAKLAWPAYPPCASKC
jgi:hypothetical protein